MLTMRIGVLTSGGDAQGMNAAVRAVVRTALSLGAEPYAILEGYQGAVDGGDRIRPLAWDDVSGILQRGGTMIGTARSADFREHDGRRRAVRNLVERGIDRLVVIGGDGSLTGTDRLRREWPDLLTELVDRGEIPAELAQEHPALMVVGLVGSIDNDLVGSDMTIGADSALHRIIEAIDAISSTAASHQRSFVIEVMGRHCGYLPLMAAVAGGADYVLVPESPPADGWEDQMCEMLRASRAAGRRESLVLVAEGAVDRHGEPITVDYVSDAIAQRLGEEPRITIPGHVQRGGTPSAYDRWMSTLLGWNATQDVMAATPESVPNILGVRHNRVTRLPMMEAVAKTQAVAGLIREGRYDEAVAVRGESFTDLLGVFETLALPPSEQAVAPTATSRRIAILHGGGLAPGMNTATRALVRFGIAHGHTMLGVTGGFRGLAHEDLTELEWGAVESLVGEGGSSLGTRRGVLGEDELYAVSRAVERADLDAIIVVGGLDAYLTVERMVAERTRFPALRLPITLLPASIDNNLPGSELSIGADTALNNAVWALDRIKQSASASRRCFVAETMGRTCGYLALLTGLAAGAERVYLPEQGVTLADLEVDVARMRAAFEGGKRLFVAVRNELAGDLYTTDFLVRLFEVEGHNLFDVRPAVLGHLQQGGNPSPFDRNLATRMAHFALNELTRLLAAGGDDAVYLGLTPDGLRTWPVAGMLAQLDVTERRPREQWWMDLLPVFSAVCDVPADLGVQATSG
jgi:6-phosphofructokinase 1